MFIYRHFYIFFMMKKKKKKKKIHCWSGQALGISFSSDSHIACINAHSPEIVGENWNYNGEHKQKMSEMHYWQNDTFMVILSLCHWLKIQPANNV